MNSIKVIRFSKKRQECSVKLKRISNEQIQKWTQCKDSSVIIQKLPEKLAKLAKKQTLGHTKHGEKEINESFKEKNNDETLNESSMFIDFESEVTKELFKREITSLDKADFEEIKRQKLETKLENDTNSLTKLNSIETTIKPKKISSKIEENKENVNPHIEDQIDTNFQVFINENRKKFLMSLEKLDNNLESNIAVEQSDEDIEIIDSVHNGKMVALKPRTTMISEVETNVETKMNSNPNKYCSIDFNQQSWNKNVDFKNSLEDIETVQEGRKPEKSPEKSPSNAVISETQNSTNVAKFFEDFYDLNEATDKKPLLRLRSEIAVKKLGLEKFTEDYKIVHESKNPDESAKNCDNSIKNIKTELSKNNSEAPNLKTCVKSVVHEEKKPIQCGICNAKFKGGVIL